MSKMTNEELEIAIMLHEKMCEGYRPESLGERLVSALKELKELRAAKPTVPSSVREVLEFYAQASDMNVSMDGGRRAMQALKDLEVTKK